MIFRTIPSSNSFHKTMKQTGHLISCTHQGYLRKISLPGT
jgi:hypothetical protein